jgi:hypothetical protein
MKFALLAFVFATSVSPIEKTIQLLEDLEAKVVKDGEAEAKVYEEFQEYCKDTAKETQFDIKTGKSGAERFAAAVDDFTAKIGVAETKIGELSDAIANDEKDLKSATAIRKKEYADFMKVDADLGSRSTCSNAQSASSSASSRRPVSCRWTRLPSTRS